MDHCEFRFSFDDEGNPREDNRGRSLVSHSRGGVSREMPSYQQHPSISIYSANGLSRSLSATNLELMAPANEDESHQAETRLSTMPLRAGRPRFSQVPSVIAESDGNESNENITPASPFGPTVSVNIMGSSSEVNITMPRRGRSNSRLRISHSNDSETEIDTRDRSRGRCQHRSQQKAAPPVTYRGIRQHYQPYRHGHRHGNKRSVSQPANRHRIPIDMYAPTNGVALRESGMDSMRGVHPHTAHRSLSAGQACHRTSTQRFIGDYQAFQDSQQPRTAQQRAILNSSRPCSRPRPPAVWMSSSSSVTCFPTQTLSPDRQKYLSPERCPSTATIGLSMNRRYAAESMEHTRYSIDPDNHGLLDLGLSALPSATSQAAETCVPLNPTATAKRQQESDWDEMEWRHGLCDPTGDCGTCWTGLFCPCISVGRTGHRLKMKTMHQDASNTYGLRFCNAPCTAFVILWGCQCFTAAHQSNRTRHAYNIRGNWMKDLLKGCLCMPCTIVQNDKEITERETRARLSDTSSQPGLIEPMVYPARLG